MRPRAARIAGPRDGDRVGRARGGVVHARDAGGDIRLRLPLPGLYNVYNALGAAALAQALGTPLEEIRAGLERFGAAFGRFERIAVGDKKLLILLIKNPAGANEVVHTLLEGGAPDLLLVALNDAIADGKDVSWIWDVDFEPLLGRADRLIASGDRAAELASALSTAGSKRRRWRYSPTSSVRSTSVSS